MSDILTHVWVILRVCIYIYIDVGTYSIEHMGKVPADYDVKSRTEFLKSQAMSSLLGRGGHRGLFLHDTRAADGHSPTVHA